MVHLLRNLFYWCIIISFLHFARSATIKMRLVKEVASYGFIGNNVGDSDNYNQLISNIEPANFSGPVLLKKLIGKCYNLTQDSYKYEFCPFQNITQYELSSRWNAYQGILGIWSHWLIQNNTFTSMMFMNGDNCGQNDRTVQVNLKCGNKEILSNVTEPSQCQYIATFETRYVCHEHALLVYPRLNDNLRNKWDDLHSKLYYGLINEKVYNENLQKIFQSAGFSQVESKSRIPVTTASNKIMTSENTFKDLFSCNKEYKTLQKEISRLHEEVEALKVMLDFIEVNNKPRK